MRSLVVTVAGGRGGEGEEKKKKKKKRDMLNPGTEEKPRDCKVMPPSCDHRDILAEGPGARLTMSLLPPPSREGSSAKAQGRASPRRHPTARCKSMDALRELQIPVPVSDGFSLPFIYLATFPPRSAPSLPLQYSVPSYFNLGTQSRSAPLAHSHQFGGYQDLPPLQARGEGGSCANTDSRVSWHSSSLP